ncbi:MAG: DNA-processing protein DprA [Solirubrobacteraceae bacterium]
MLAVRRDGADLVSARAVLEHELGLFSYEALSQAEAEIRDWQARGYRLMPMFDHDYPENLRVTGHHPPLLFIAGELAATDRRGVAVIGGRAPSPDGSLLAGEVATVLAGSGFTVFSGLAAGIDARAHQTVLKLQQQYDRGTFAAHARPRTVAVIGTGLDHVYPAQNAALQRDIVRNGAVVSQFWPDTRASRHNFPLRNALMSGLTLGSVIVEASEHSGTRIQAKHALSQGRMVVLMPGAMGNAWARELAQRPETRVIEDAAALLDVLPR